MDTYLRETVCTGYERGVAVGVALIGVFIAWIISDVVLFWSVLLLCKQINTLLETTIEI